MSTGWRDWIIFDVKPWPSGNPGAFLFISSDRVNDLEIQLRAYDISRDATNFGTQIPVVHEDEFVDVERDPIVLLGVPTDERFRNTLRIYSTHETGAIVELYSNQQQGMLQWRRVYLSAPGSAFEPAYAEVNDLPVGVGTLRVRIVPGWADGPPPSPPWPGPQPGIWAFISVTNNDTQHITVISPQH